MNFAEVMIVSTGIASAIAFVVTAGFDLMVMKWSKLRDASMPGRDERDAGNVAAKRLVEDRRTDGAKLQAAATIIQATAIVDAARLIRGAVIFAAVLAVAAPAVSALF